jgi:8-oxo-dGTP pyrophosphatase MutT (NUDIX family)
MLGTESHLPPIPAERLTLGFVRSRMRACETLDWQPEFLGDNLRLRPDAPVAESAVLVGLIASSHHDDARLSVLLTQRSAALKHHSGQVSFPGGRRDADDADLVATALRESNEEVGLARDRVEVLGRLPTYTTVTSYGVAPVVGIVHATHADGTSQPLNLKLQRSEVDAAFEVPLSFLMTPSNHQRHRFAWEGGTHDFLSMPWREPVTDASAALGTERFIWGATAAMIRNLYRLLAA